MQDKKLKLQAILNTKDPFIMARFIFNLEDSVNDLKNQLKTVNTEQNNNAEEIKSLTEVITEIKSLMESISQKEIDLSQTKGERGNDGEKGEKGDKGDKGDNGYTPIKGKDYFDGLDGHTPIKGIDYFDGEKGEDYVLTPKDIIEIAKETLKQFSKDKILKDLKDEIDLVKNREFHIPKPQLLLWENISGDITKNKQLEDYINTFVGGNTIDWSSITLKGKYTGAKTTIATGIVYNWSYQSITYYRCITTAKTNGYPNEDAYYLNFTNPNLTDLIATRA